jgi:hypothetical protein
MVGCGLVLVFMVGRRPVDSCGITGGLRCYVYGRLRDWWGRIRFFAALRATAGFLLARARMRLLDGVVRKLWLAGSGRVEARVRGAVLCGKATR